MKLSNEIKIQKDKIRVLSTGSSYRDMNDNILKHIFILAEYQILLLLSSVDSKPHSYSCQKLFAICLQNHQIGGKNSAFQNLKSAF